MTWVDESRWTCPTCRITVTFLGPVDDARLALDAVMIKHGQDHPARRKKPTPLAEARRLAKVRAG